MNLNVSRVEELRRENVFISPIGGGTNQTVVMATDAGALAQTSVLNDMDRTIYWLDDGVVTIEL